MIKTVQEYMKQSVRNLMRSDDMNILKWPSKIINHIKKTRYMKSFKSFDRSSYIDESCKIIGKENIVIGSECSIGPCCEIIAFNSHLGQELHSDLTIGNHVRITSRCRITCAGTLSIGNDVLIAPDVMITDHNHGMDPTYPGGYSPQPLLVGETVVGDGVWLGRGVCVLSNVTIGAHSIIGANSVVTHDIPEYCMAVGSPAKTIKRYNLKTKQWEKVYDK